MNPALIDFPTEFSSSRRRVAERSGFPLEATPPNDRRNPASEVVASSLYALTFAP